jgi:hypothetical protein
MNAPEPYQHNEVPPPEYPERPDLTTAGIGSRFALIEPDGKRYLATVTDRTAYSLTIAVRLPDSEAIVIRGFALNGFELGGIAPNSPGGYLAPTNADSLPFLVRRELLLELDSLFAKYREDALTEEEFRNLLFAIRRNARRKIQRDARDWNRLTEAVRAFDNPGLFARDKGV